MKLLKIILLISTLYITAFSANILDLEEITQRKDQWCWAGCSYTILTYYGDNVSQGQIVQYAYGDSSINQWNWLNGHYDVEYQGVTYNPHGINEILDHWNTPNAYGYYSLSQTEWKQEVDDGHPFVIRWGWNNGGGHFVVGQGYLDNGNYQIMDPWYGCGYTINTYNWMMSAKNQGNWTHSLTTDRSISVTKYTLTVNSGSGGGEYAEGTNVTITADQPQVGYTFDKWTGSIANITNANSETTTVTIPSQNISLTATYIDTTTPIDTTNPSKNLVLIAGWEDSKDSYGSTLSMDSSKASSDTIITGDYSITSSDTGAGEWPWASVTGYTGNDFENVTAIKVVYKSSTPIKLVLEEPILSDSGVAFYRELESSSSYKTVYIAISSFKQPGWTTSALQQSSPDLKLINAVSFTSDYYGTSTSFELKDLVLFNYKGDLVSLFNDNSKNMKDKILIRENCLFLNIQNKGDVNIALYSLSGKKLFEQSFKSDINNYNIPLHSFSNQSMIVKVKGNDFNFKKVVSIVK